MKIRNGKYGRKAISPIIATVLIIAVTLIAAVAIGGFVFGIFGSASNTAQIEVTSVVLSASIIVSPAGHIGLTNTGTVNTEAAAAVPITLTYGGVTCQVLTTDPVETIAAGAAAVSIPIAAPGTAGQYCGAANPSAVAGETFTGTIGLTNGELATFTGAFTT